jgi:serine protease Do
MNIRSLFLLLLFNFCAIELVLGQAEYIDLLSKNVVQIETTSGSGSGIVVPIDDELFIYTNRHIVEGHYQFSINTLSDVNEPAQPKFMADLVGYSADFDFALLLITTTIDGSRVDYSDAVCISSTSQACFTELSFQDDNLIVKRGENIGVMGYPGIGNNELIYSNGIISSLKYEVVNNRRTLVWLRTDAQMSPGNSGGIAFNSTGTPIGIPTSVSREQRTGGRLGNILSFDVIFSALDSEELSTTWESNTDSQLVLDFSQEPLYGSVSLSPNFSPNLFKEEIIAGGSNNVNYLGEDCIGYASTSPDFRLQWNGTTEDLYIMFMAEDDNKDATLVINTPNGDWLCNDDAFEGTLNPALHFNFPTSGQYDIWVGSYYEEEYVGGNLLITEYLTDNNQENVNIDPQLSPHFGTENLSAGFLPDPYSVSVSAGGSINISESNLGSDCVGYVAEAPDFRVQWSGESSQLFFSFIANQAGEDATFIINSPDGNWHCNDDAHSDTLNPQIKFLNPLQGQYDIWIGSYRDGDLIEGRLQISEIENDLP